MPGKMKTRKNKFSGRGDSFQSNESLSSQIVRGRYAGAGREAMVVEDDTGTTIVDHNLSIKILKQATQQREELENELAEEASKTSTDVPGKSDEEDEDDAASSSKSSPRKGAPILQYNDDEEFPALGAASSSTAGGVDGAGGDYDYEDDAEVDIDAEDVAAFEKFMPKGPEKLRTLAEIIQDKINERKTEMSTRLSDNGSVQLQELDPRFIELFKNVGDILSKYRAGKLPKAFKIIPKLANWEQVLFLTDPDKWTAATMLQATRIFISNLNPKMCQRFLNIILLPRLRDDIAQYKKLNFHLYQALKKSLFKPAAFFKGILLPLCESGCTLKECAVFASVLTSCSVPMLHAAAALLKLAEMQYTPANSMFLRVLIDKRYALPFRVVDGLVHHFLRFAMDSRAMPVLWHQALLSLATNYAGDISDEQKEALLDLLKKHGHPKITPSIRHQLNSAQGQKEAGDADMGEGGVSGSKVSFKDADLPETDNPDME